MYSYAYDFSAFQVHRHTFIPQIPSALASVNTAKLALHTEDYPIAEGLNALFPTLLKSGMKYFEHQVSESGEQVQCSRPLRLGCVLSGGQAAGGHNVIMGLYDMAKKLHPDSQLFGFLAGPHGVYTGNY